MGGACGREISVVRPSRRVAVRGCKGWQAAWPRTAPGRRRSRTSSWKDVSFGTPAQYKHEHERLACIQLQSKYLGVCFARMHKTMWGRVGESMKRALFHPKSSSC